MKQLVSHRLDRELLALATAYAESRGTSRAVVIEEGLRVLLDAAKTGVPDLPVVDSPEVRRRRAEVAAGGLVRPAREVASPESHASVMSARQRALAKKMGWDQ